MHVPTSSSFVTGGAAVAPAVSVGVGGIGFALSRSAVTCAEGTAAPATATKGLLPIPTTRALQGEYDVCVVGGGIIGLATAREILLRRPGMRVVVLEKEGEVAAHQTGHNSGVIHAGIYYEPGSRMAECCVQGAAKMYTYCEAEGIPHKRIGKLICTWRDDQYHVLETLLQRGTTNGVKGLRILNREEVKELEPNVDVPAALLSPNTGVVDYAVVAQHFAKDVTKHAGSSVQCGFAVAGINLVDDGAGGRVVEVTGLEPGQSGPLKVVRARHVITCCGLQSDRVAIGAGGDTKPKVLAFRGTYYQMKAEHRNIVQRNVYPIPSGGGIPVGVHFTPTVNERRGEQMIVGPGACLAFSREGYSFFDLSLGELFRVVTNAGFWRFAFSNFDLAFTEFYRDANKNAFLGEARKLVPGLKDDQVEASFRGVMAQVFMDDGTAAKDYIFERKKLEGTTLHVRNAPTPACTSSIHIGEHIVDLAQEDFNWPDVATK